MLLHIGTQALLSVEFSYQGLDALQTVSVPGQVALTLEQGVNSSGCSIS